MSDARLSYIASTLADVFGESTSASSLLSQLSASPAVSAFCDDPHTTLLCTTINAAGQLTASNTVDTAALTSRSPSKAKPHEESKEQLSERTCEVHMLKRERAILPSQQLSAHVMMLTTFDSPLYSLYLTLHNVYGPKLTQAAADVPAAIQQQFIALEQQLHRTLLTSKAAAAPSSDDSTDNSSSASINSVQDELTYWTELSHSSRHKQQAQLFLPHLETLTDKLEPLSTLDPSDIPRLSEELADTLHDIWMEDDDTELAYPQSRMVRLFGVIGRSVSSRVRSALEAADVLDGAKGGKWVEVKELMLTCMAACEAWTTAVRDLVRQNEWKQRWKANKKHEADEDDLEEVEVMRERIEQVMKARALYEELTSLLPSSALLSSPAAVFAPFNTFALFQPSPFTAPLFPSALSAFHSSLAPVESAAISPLKQRITSLSTQPALLLPLLLSYPTLLSRPQLLTALEGERRGVVSRMVEMVEAMKAEWEAVKAGDAVPGGSDARGMSELCVRLSWCHAMKARLSSIASVISRVFPSKDTDKFSVSTRALAERIGSFAKQTFQSWQSAILASLSDPSSPLHLSTTGAALMELDLRGEGELLVHYSGELVTLLRECRLVCELGYRLDTNIDKTVKVADKYYRYGLRLRQIANLYNSMSEQILPSQLGMLVMEAQQFESIVKEGGQKGKGWDWQRLDECDRYVERLESAAEELMNRNRKVRAAHYAVAQLAGQALQVDNGLWKGRDTFMEHISRMRTVFAREDKLNTAAAMRTWKQHWEQQTYKILNVHYRQLLYSLTEHSAMDIPIDLTFTRRRLAFRPPIEEIRSSYYRTVKRHLDLPKSFQGLLDTSGSLYASIPERNADGLLYVFQQCERLFVELDALLVKYEPWMALGMVDIDELVSERLSVVSDWELNFRTLKAKRKESERVPDTVKVGCFTVSLLGFKSVLDDQMHRFSDTLLLSLRKSTQSSQQTVDTFIKDAMASLAALPSSMEEMEQAKQRYESIMAQKPDMALRMSEMAEKDQLLRAMTSIVSIDLATLKARWDDFLTQADAYTDYLADQTERLKEDVGRQCVEMGGKVDSFVSRWQALKPSTDVEGELTAEMAEKCIAEMEQWKEEWAAVKRSVDAVTSHCQTFNLALPSFPASAALEAELASYSDSWSFFSSYRRELEAMAGEQWVAFRPKLSSFDDLTNSWTKKLKARGSRDKIYDYLMQQIRNNREVFPVLRKVTGEFYEKDHWRLLFSYIGLPSSTSAATLTFQQLLDKSVQLIERNKDISALTARAQGEVTIREAVEELKTWGEHAKFALLDYDKSVVLIKDWKDLFTTLSDQQALASSLKESPYYAMFEDTARQIETKLATLDNVLHTLQTIQRKWVYLYPIFSKGALPQEQARFKRIDTDFRQVMGGVKDSPLVMALAAVPHLQETVSGMNEQMDRCQRALNDYLEEKRSKFPRFYFIGDDDLLEILGQSSNPTVIQSHLKKLYAGINAVEFNANNTQIVAILSGERERVPLGKPVDVSDDVEGWLTALTASMEVTLQTMVVECLRKGADLQGYPSQVLCLSEMIAFTDKVEQVLAAGGQQSPDAVMNGLQSLLSAYQQQLTAYTSFDTQDDKLLELKLKSLVFDLIHNLDVLRQLVDAKASTLDHWMWQKQLRFYLNQKSQLAVVRMCDATFDYTYEYQGNYEKLVHTPLSDKCYLVLTQGMHLGYGGCPFGPAGTGKTESVKALAAAMGRICIVFNCDEGIDFQSMGRIFTGLVKSGAWGCFDEFNRLKEDQLSAVSQQIQVIQHALKQRQPTCTLLNQSIHVNFNAAIFVTMNPVSKEYGGRSKLPHNLKQLFRDVAMAAPDIALIAEVILLAAGFTNAGLLGRKIVEIFDLSRQLLSPQRHYDWGLRALKTILRHADQLVHTEKRTRQTLTLSVEQETELVIGALRMNTLSKLTFADSVRFNALLSDVFPGSRITEIDYSQLQSAIEATLTDMKLERVDKQVKKIIQLYEAAHQRMGVVLVGPSGCGKSTMLTVLEAAMKRLGQRVVRHVMNPKAMERQKLLGWMDYDTREFRDGTLIAASRAVMRESADTQSWVICDGDIDPEWIESLNSVLDDNHLLTMPNGERIKFNNNVNFIFESHDLQFASPATVSRMGMIFLSEEDVDIPALVTAWVKRQRDEVQARLSGWMDELFYQSLAWVLDANADVVKRTKVGLVLTGLSHLRTCETKSQFVIGLIRGLGSNLEVAKRVEFAKAVFGWSGERPADPRDPLNSYYDTASSSVLGYQHRETAKAAAADDEDDEAPPPLSFRSPPLIWTQDVQRHSHLIEPWLASMEPFILVGPEGCGKTLLLEHSFAALKGTSVTTINCSAETSAAHVISKLNDSCAILSTPKGRVFRPKEGDRLIIFLKDLNLPRPDKYDTIQLIAFLQQLITYKGFYDDSLEWVSIDRIQLVATMNPVTAVGRSQLSTRFTATVHVAYITYPDHEALIHIYSAFMARVMDATPTLADGQWRDRQAQRKLTTTLVDVYEKVRVKLSVDEHGHYLFCPRDITQWLFGLLRYDLGRENVLTVLLYEARRLVGDRLVDATAMRTFETIVATVLRQQWKYEEKEEHAYFSSMAALSESAGSATSAAEPVATNRELGPPLERVTAVDFKEIVTEGLRSYERDYKSLRMLLFPEILDHLAYQDRVLSRPGGSLLLIGSSGVGRRSSVTLLCHMQHVQLFTPAVSHKYDLKTFRTDLKELMRAAGVEGRSVVLYVEDYQIVRESFLEDINSLLSAGEISGLYQTNEMDALLSPLKDEYVSNGYGCRSMYEFFVSRVRANLHIVLSMDPHHPLFHRRCESNPALYTRLSVMWMGSWTNAGLVAVPQMRLQSVLAAKRANGQPVDPQRVLDQLLFMHQSCLSKPAVSGVTPLKYVALLDTYQQVFDSHATKLSTQRSHLTAGLAKLRDAAAAVDVLSRDAATKQVLVTKKQQEADAALDAITSRMAQASERKMEVETLQQTLGKEEEKLNVEKKTIAQQLTEVEPILAEAKAAVGGIKKDNLNEIRAFRMPPTAITHVLSGVLGLLKQDDTSWANMKKFLASPSVKDEIMNFDAAKIDPRTREKVQKIIDGSGGSFEPVTIMRVNVAAAPLAKWCLACVRYSEVFEQVRPLQQRLDAANAQLDSARERLVQCTEDLRTVDGDVKKLKATFGKVTGEAETLKVELERTNSTLTAAQSLLDKLSGEQERWEATVAELSGGLDALTNHAMLAAGFISYLGGCDEDVRAEMVQTWKDKLTAVGGDEWTKAPAFELQSFMASESTFLTWKAEGLSSDQLSMQNGLIIKHSQQTPYILDPNGIAVAWLQRHLTALGQSVEVVMQQDPKLVNTLELSVRFGKTLLITEVDGVLPLLVPLLRRDLVRQGPRSVVSIGDKAVDYNDNFRLYLITRNQQSDLTADSLALLNSVNFTVTRSGLEGQLLGLTLAHERPELETKKSQLLAAEDELKLRIAELEKRLLEELAASQGNILDNKSLIDSLNNTKQQAMEIRASLANSKEIAADLDRQREVYRPIAAAGSRLFFLLSQLTAVNNMYDFSLTTFTSLFNANLDAQAANGGGGGAGSDSERIERMVEGLKLSVFNYVTRSLFKADRLMFALHLLHSLYPQLFAESEWEYFIDTLVVDGKDGETAVQPLPSHFATASQSAYATLVAGFPQLVRSLRLSDESTWSKWCKSPRPEADFPAFANERSLTAFQRLMAIKALRPDRLQTAMTQFACEQLAVSNVSPPPFNLLVLCKEVANTQPILFVCEGGADPTADLEDFADKTVGRQRLLQIAMSSGQTDEAIELLTKAAKEGYYLLLKNVHLCCSWCVTLEKTLKSLQSSLHASFRLFLTTESHPSFPPILLQQSCKIAYEAPPGIKQNLLRTYSQWDASFVANGGVVRAQLLFVLAWFHAIVQERRTYIPQGWTKVYEFSGADLRSGADIIDSLCVRMKRAGGGGGGDDLNAAAIPWTTIWGLFKFAIYGGRIDIPHDERVLVTYLRKFFHKDILFTPGKEAGRKLTAGLSLPASNTHGEYVALIQRLPDVDAPNLFSLPDNIDAAVQQNQSSGVVVQLRKLAVSNSSLGRFDRQAWKAALSPLLTMWDKLTNSGGSTGGMTARGERKPTGLLTAPPKLNKREEEYSPLESFVVNENTKAHQLMQTLHTTLAGLSAVLTGNGLLTDDLFMDGQALMVGSVPWWRWCKLWSGPEDPAVFMREVVARKQSLLSWLTKCDKAALLDAAVRLNELFTPKVFLNALRQQTARITNQPIDTLKLVAAFKRNSLPTGLDSQLVVTVSGLLLQGCGFAADVLSPLQSDSPSVISLPDAYFCYIGKQEMEPYPDAQGGLAVPLYYSVNREQLVCEVRMPCKGQLDRWVLTGAALFITQVK